MFLFFSVSFCVCLACCESCWRRDIGIAFPVMSATMSSFCDYVSFSITTQPRFILLGPNIDHGGYISARYVSPDVTSFSWCYWVKFLGLGPFLHYHTTEDHYIWSTYWWWRVCVSQSVDFNLCQFFMIWTT